MVKREDFCTCLGATYRSVEGSLVLLRCKDCGKLAPKEREARHPDQPEEGYK